MLFPKKIPFANASRDIDDVAHVSRLEQRDVERCFARLFSTEDGRKVLAWLQVMTFQRVANATASDNQLRYAEGQRSLMASILRLIDRGRTN